MTNPVAWSEHYLEPGCMVVLHHVTPELLHGLPEDDQTAIQAILGRPVTFTGYSFGQAEVEFTDEAGDLHTIWVQPSWLGELHA